MYVGEIRMFAGNFPPNGWEFCDGALLSIAEHETLFSLIGTMYGGDGVSNFALPDFRGRVPVHRSTDHPQASSGGREQESLSIDQLPAHTHALGASTAAPAAATSAIDITGPVAYVPGSPAARPRLYAPHSATVAMAPNAIGATGGAQPHNNMAPWLGVNFIISMYGVYPPRF